MNNVLNFNRLLKVIRLDALNYTQRFLKTMIIIIIGVLFAGWLIGTKQKANLTGEMRLPYFFICFIIITIIAPETLYGDANDPRKGIRFATLPASALEKTISMVFYCAIVTPILAGIICLITDSILGLLPFGAFKGSFSISYIGESTRLITDLFLQEIFYSCIFIFGIVLFKKRQSIKTIACLIALIILLICIVTPTLFSQYGRKMMIMATGTFSGSEGNIEPVSMVIHYIILALLLVGIYLRVKKQKY